MKSKFLQENWQSQNDNTNEPAKQDQIVKAKKSKPKLKLVRTNFGVELDHFIPNIRFEFRNKRIVLLPYAHQPFIEYDPDKGIILTTMQRVIIITGQRLGVLVEYFQGNTLSWLKESKSKIDSEQTEIYIESFEIRPLTD